MLVVLLPLSAFALLGAAEPDPPKAGPALRSPEIDVISPSPEQCRDRITNARDATGKPRLLDRAPASPDKPYRIYAVDKRINGCTVMVMHDDVTDIRPLPALPDAPARIVPLKSRQ